MTKRLSLRARLRRVIIVTGISFYLLTSLIVAAVEIKKKKSDYASAMITTVKTCEAIIIDYINQYHEYIQHVTAKMPDSAEPMVINYFQENLHFQNRRDMYYILDYHNRIIHIHKPYEQYQGLDLSHIEHISEKIPVSKVHQSLFSQQPVVSFLYPLAGNRLLVLEKDLKGIIPLAEHFNLGEIFKGGYLFILSYNGTVVYHPDRQLIDSRHDLGFELTDWSNSDARGLQTFTYHDKKYLCYRVTLEKPIGWTLYFVVPNIVLFRAIIYHVAQIFLIFAAVFSSLIFFLQLIMNKKLSKPVSEIVTSISTCNLDGTDEPIPQSKASGTKELTSIIDAINNMMAELNRSSENLKESEQRHRTLVETMTDVVFTLDTNGRFTFLNPESEKLIGYPAQDFIGHSFTEILAPEYIESTTDRFRRGLSGETIPIYEVEVIRKDGKKVPIELNVTSLLDAHGNPVGRIGVARDISERKQADKTLRKSEQEKAALLYSTTEHVVYHDKEHKVLWANRAAGESVGFAPEQLVGRYCYEIWQQRNEPCIGCPVEKAIETGQLQEAEMTTPDERAWFIRGNPVRDVNGNIIGGLETTLEITKHKQAEEALRVSETQKKAILDASIDRIRLVDTDMRIIWANKTTTRELNIAPEDLVGQFCYKVFVGRDSPCTGCPTIKVFESGNTEQAILHHTYSKGIEGETYWDSHAVPIKNESGDIVNIIQTSRNITERKRAEEEKKKLEAKLQRAQKMEAIGTLAGGVAHDLNNILSAQVSYPDLLLLDLPEDSPLRKPILTIQQSGQKAADIVQDLLTLARRGVVATEVTNLNQIINSYLNSPECEKLKEFHPDAKIESDLETYLLNIMGSPVHLSKTVMNLVSNAAEAMPDGGNIFISTESKYIDKPIRGYDDIKEGDYVILTVSDTGVGISKEDRERIFEPFYTKKVMGRSGTGLGMAVVWGTVKDHKGYIDVQSTEGKGATFTLYFPVTRKEIHGKEKALPMEKYMGNGESILVVDDVEEQKEIASNIIKKLGYSVTSVSSGEEAIDYMKDNSTDLLVLDMIMDPGIDGLETYRRILEFHPGQKAIIASGFSETQRVKQAQRLGAGKYIKKPYTLEKIGLAVKEELEKE